MKRERKAGPRTVMAWMLPHVTVLFVVWMVLFALWHLTELL